jgi:hypothetical protein
MKRVIGVMVALALAGLIFLSAKSVKTIDSNKDGKPDMWYELENGVLVKVSTDKNFDGIVDSIAEYSQGDLKKYEEIDFNKDGKMDDFYYYKDGILNKREIDSDYNGKIDLWVYLSDDGQYVIKWERDLNGDGLVDKVKNFQ